MARMKPAYYYQRQATIAQARDQYRLNNPPSPNPGPIQSRGASTTLFYRSLTLSNGANPLMFTVNVPNDTLSLISAAQLGLVEALGPGDVSLRLRGSGVKPSRIHWFEGIGQPVRRRTPWGSSWTKYFEDKTYSAPFSQRVGTFSAKDLRDNFESLFGVDGSERNLLGQRNGRAWMTLEQAPITFNT